MIAAFSAADQLRRRPAPVNTSMRRTGSGICLCSEIDMCRSPHPLRQSTFQPQAERCPGNTAYTCWNGEVVRVAFALDCHDREAISWIATTAGISGEMIRDMMVRCVEQRFGALRAPHPVQWLSDN